MAQFQRPMRQGAESSIILLLEFNPDDYASVELRFSQDSQPILDLSLNSITYTYSDGVLVFNLSADQTNKFRAGRFIMAMRVADSAGGKHLLPEVLGEVVSSEYYERGL